MPAKQSILSRIKSSFSRYEGLPLDLKALYTLVKGKKHSIRARIYENGSMFKRVGKGLYIHLSTQIGKQADCFAKVEQMVKDDVKFDFIMLDLPYAGSGQRGGNRNLADFAIISPDQFGHLCGRLAKLVGENTPVCFIFSNGKTSQRLRAKYQAAIEKHFKIAGKRAYTKTYKNGDPVRFGKYVMPTEELVIMSKSGEVDRGLEQFTDISEIRPNRGSYPTQKPISLFTRLYEWFCEKTALIFDPFAGAGTTGNAAQQLGMSSLSLDIAHNPSTFNKSGL